MSGTFIARMSGGGESKLSPQVEDLKIKKLIVHQNASKLLYAFNGKHCYAQLLFQNGSRAIIQRGANFFSVSVECEQRVRSNKICQTNCYFQGTLKNLKNKLQRFIQFNEYHVYQNNCYHFIIYFMRLIQLDTNKIKDVQNALNYVIHQKALGRATVSQLGKLADSADDVARAGYIAATVGQKAGQQALIQSFKSVSKFGVVATVIGQSVCQVIQMHRHDYQPEKVAKGIGNIAVGSAGAVGGGWGGASAGAAIGAIGGPVGIIIGGVIGSVGGSMLGSTFAKKIMPWNWS